MSIDLGACLCHESV